MKPSSAAVNRSPTLTAAVSPESLTVGVVVPASRVHGQTVTAAEDDAAPVPATLAAATLKVYDVPGVSPVTVAVVSGGVPVTRLAV